MNKHSILHKLLIFIPTLIFSALVFRLGNNFPKGYLFLEYIAVFLITFLAAFNCVAMKFARKKTNIKPPKFSLKKVFLLAKIYSVVIFLLLLFSLFFSGILWYELPLVSSLFAVFAVYMIYRFLFAATMTLEAASDCRELDRESYTKLYEIAENAVKSIGLKGNIRLFSQWGFQPSATTIDNEIRIIFGTHIPAIVNEYELEALFVSELGLIKFGSITADSQIKKKVAHWQIAFFGGNELFPNFYLLFPYKIIEAKTIKMIKEAEEHDDNIRLDSVSKFGIPSDFINATAKLTEYEFFLKSPPTFSVFDLETPPCDFQQRLVSKFKNSPIKNYEKLNQLILNTDQCGFKMPLLEKLKILGTDGFNLSSNAISQSYIFEAESLLKLGNDDFYYYIKESFNKSREKDHIPHLKLTQKYESDIQNGIIYNDTDRLEVALSYLAMAKPKEAEEMIDSILIDSPNMANALLEKGRLLLSRLDESGIELIINSTNYNKFIKQKAYFSIIAYYHLLGDTENKKKYLDIFEKSSEGEGAYYEEIFNISSSEDYSDTALSYEALEDIKENINNMPLEAVDLILLASRKIEDEEPVNFIFIKFSDSVSDEDIVSLMKKIHFYLDNREENYYLITDKQNEKIFHLARNSEKIITIYKKEI
ncbi:MAG: hypothetical protein IJO00_00230 [Clostridia bacterium]|nr:hypothetical protein [Clostridia bacterium]